MTVYERLPFLLFVRQLMLGKELMMLWLLHEEMLKNWTLQHPEGDIQPMSNDLNGEKYNRKRH